MSDRGGGPRREWDVLTIAEYDRTIEWLASDLEAAMDRTGTGARARRRKLGSFFTAAKLIRMAIFDEEGLK